MELCDRTREPIVFCKTTEPYGWLHNMCSGFPISYDGTLWLSSEHLYQAHRFDNIRERDYIASKKNGFLAKQTCRQLLENGSGYPAEIWDFVKVDIMYFCLQLKFGSHENIRRSLIDTHPLPLVEYSTKDSFWGAKKVGGKLVGKNTLGKLLMKLRLEFMNAV
jgi:ribA/ribD-fused uncharacterized protein